MIAVQVSDSNAATYRQMKERVAGSYPSGWFVAIAENQILAAAADFHALESQLRTQGTDPRNVLVVEAGVDYPEHATIFI